MDFLQLFSKVLFVYKNIIAKYIFEFLTVCGGNLTEPNGIVSVTNLTNGIYSLSEVSIHIILILFFK